MQLHLFEQVGEVVRAMVPAELGAYQQRTHRRGLKVWFGSADKPRRDHFEAQIIAYRHLDTDQPQPEGRFAIEIGFHAEFGDPAKNQQALDQVLKAKKSWKNVLGTSPEAGEFLGNSDWRRLSEVWMDVEPDEPELAFEVASRLVDYIESVQPQLDVVT